MSIFNQKIDYNKSSNVDLLESYVNEETIEPCEEESLLEANARIVAEAEYNYNKFMQTVGIAELAHFEENGEELVYEASTAGSFLDKVKQFFVNLWSKIVALFKKFFAMFDSAIKSDKEFLNKYKKYINKISSSDISDMEYKGFKYDYKTDMLKSAAEKMESLIGDETGYTSSQLASLGNIDKSNFDKLSEKEDVVDKMRARALGKMSDSYTESEFQKELFAILRSGEDSKDTLPKIEVSKYVAILEGSKGRKSAAEKQYKETKDIINKVIKACEDAKKVFEKATPDSNSMENNSRKIAVCSRVLGLEKTRLTIAQTINTALLKAIKDENKQARAILIKAMSYRKKEKGSQSAFMKESASIFDTVDFI